MPELNECYMEVCDDGNFIIIDRNGASSLNFYIKCIAEGDPILSKNELVFLFSEFLDEFEKNDRAKP